ncbi:MAG TPA: tryptophan synthase subunit alpha [Thermomicrobiales bacterium]|nr:tryptophan synthase subunit alpha [Thermomicrobiales bacterium]
MTSTDTAQPATAAAPSRIAATFAALRREGRVALMPYLTVGFPDVETTLAGVPALIRGGADLIELGMPFSDPIADGVTVQRANQRALDNGVWTGTALDVARTLRARGVDAPLSAMGYVNPLLRYGLDRFAADCAAAGIDGLIVPDLPPEESDELAAACRRHGRDLIMLLAPTSTEARIAAVARRATGFIYCISLTGITGARASLAEGLADYIARVRRHTDLPLVIGFGISTAEHVAEVAQIADGAVVASALLNRLEEVADRPVAERAAALEAFTRGLRG